MEKIDVQEILDEWFLFKDWVDGHTDDFEDLDTLADGVALTRVKNAPVVGDVTLGSAIRQIPRNSVRQVPVFSAVVNGSKKNIPAIFSGFLLRDKVFNQDTFGKGTLSTIQIGAESALTRGFQMFTASFDNVQGGYGSTLKPVHYDDFAVTRGIFDFSESQEYYLRTRITRSRLKKLIKSAKANPDTTWNVKALERMLKEGPSGSTSINRSSAPRRTNGDDADDNRYDFIFKYGVGPYYEIVVVSPSCDEPLRVTKSRSKFGYPRMQGLVIDPDQLSPFGVSRARLATPAANYANIYLQSTAKMQLINADPPIFQSGQFLTPIRLKRQSLWKSNDPNAKVQFMELSNSTLTQFRNVLDFVDNQILSIMGVGSAQNAPSSTYQNKDAVQAREALKDLSVEQVTSITENFLRQYALTALDLYVSEQSGVEDVIIDDEAKDAINDLYKSRFVPQVDPATGMPKPFVPPVGDDNKLTIDWEKFYESVETWTVEIDLSMGKDQMEAKTRADLQDAVTVASQTTDPADPEGLARKRALEDKLFEKMVPDLNVENEIPQAQPMAGQAAEM